MSTLTTDPTTDLIYIIDPNQADGDLVPVSMLFTLNYGPRTLAWGTPPDPGTEVRVYADEDAIAYRAVVERVLDSRTFVVAVKWASGEDTARSDVSALHAPHIIAAPMTTTTRISGAVDELPLTSGWKSPAEHLPAAR